MKFRYRPEIDGLRAIAVVSVILYHAQINILGHQFFKGGFIGVDIFFVISGYLITSIILNEFVTTGSFSFKYFYEGRIRRILPALLFVMLISLPIAWIILIPSSIIDFSKSILYSLGFSSNFYFHYTGQQYGAESGYLKPFLHTWSLSVEKQYYIIFPIVLFITFKYFRRYLIHTLILGFLASLGLADWGSKNHPSFNFYVLPTRGWELLAGSILAYFEINNGYRIKNKIIDLILPGIGLLLIVHSILFFNDKMFHPSFYTLQPIIGVCLIIWFSNKNDLITKILSTKIFVGIGLISYSLYLWHYPIFAFQNYLSYQIFENNLVTKLILIIVSFIFSVISFLFIEKKFRNKKFNFKKIVLVILSLATLIISTTFLILITDGGKKRFEGSKFYKEIYDSKKNGLNNLNGTPCFNNPHGCEFNILSDKKVFIIGDSLVNTISNDLNHRLVSKGYQTNFFYIGDCLYFPKFDRVLRDTKIIDKKCNKDYFSRIEKKILNNNNSIIIFFGRFTLQLSNKRFDNKEGGLENDNLIWEYDLISEENISRKISFINSINKISKSNKIIFLYPLPEIGWKVEKIIYKKKINLKTFSTSFDVFKNRNQISFKFLDNFKSDNIFRIFPHKLFCETIFKSRCIIHNNSNIFYSDSLHPSITGAKMINDLIMKEVEKIEP